jgi:hypothetical protein
MTGRQESYDVHQLLQNMINKLFIDFKDRFNELCNNCDDKQRRLTREVHEVKFGFSALLTLNHCFRTQQISHIIDSNNRFQVSLKAMIKDQTFYIPLPNVQKYNQFVKYMVQNNDEFIEKLKALTACLEIKLEPFQKNNSHYYLLTASGTVWCLRAIKHFIAHPFFFNEVIRENWSKKNLTLYGITSNQYFVSHSNP